MFHSPQERITEGEENQFIFCLMQNMELHQILAILAWSDFYQNCNWVLPRLITNHFSRPEPPNVSHSYVLVSAAVQQTVNKLQHVSSSAAVFRGANRPRRFSALPVFFQTNLPAKSGSFWTSPSVSWLLDNSSDHFCLTPLPELLRGAADQFMVFPLPDDGPSSHWNVQKLRNASGTSVISMFCYNKVAKVSMVFAFTHHEVFLVTPWPWNTFL